MSRIPLKVPEKWKHYALTDYEIRRLNPDAVFIPYDQVKYFHHIDDLFAGKRKAIILYLFETNSGHYTCLFKRDRILSYFNSYGKEPDDDVLKLEPEKRIRFNEVEPHLFQLMAESGLPCEYNNVRMQSPKTATCGWHVTNRLWYAHLSPEDYVAEMQISCDHFKCYADTIVISDVLPKLSKIREK